MESLYLYYSSRVSLIFPVSCRVSTAFLSPFGLFFLFARTVECVWLFVPCFYFSVCCTATRLPSFCGPFFLFTWTMECLSLFSFLPFLVDPFSFIPLFWSFLFLYSDNGICVFFLPPFSLIF